MHSFFVPLFAGLASIGSAQKCPLHFDARVPSSFKVEDFDTKNSPFNPDNVIGKGLKMSGEVQLVPDASADSLFDKSNNSVPVNPGINDKSIFAPSATNIQTGFRRIDLIPASNDGKDASTQGIKTLHFSIKKDLAKPLNTSHEYQLVYLETATYDNLLFQLRTGTLLDAKVDDPDTLILTGNANKFNGTTTTLFKTKFTSGFHNFALTMDFNKNLIRTYYSTGTTALKVVGDSVRNDLSGQGQIHFAILKKPTGGSSDPSHNGFQPIGIKEGIIYGGLFMEDSSNECISLSDDGSSAGGSKGSKGSKGSGRSKASGSSRAQNATSPDGSTHSGGSKGGDHSKSKCTKGDKVNEHGKDSNKKDPSDTSTTLAE